jgi:hypothetical protein
MAATPGSFDAYVGENEIADEDLAQGFRDWLAEPPGRGRSRPTTTDRRTRRAGRELAVAVIGEASEALMPAHRGLLTEPAVARRH